MSGLFNGNEMALKIIDLDCIVSPVRLAVPSKSAYNAFMKGPLYGADHIITASQGIDTYNRKLNFDVENLSIYTETPVDFTGLSGCFYDDVILSWLSQTVLKTSAFPILLGGSHQLSPFGLRTLTKVIKKGSIAVVQFDSRPDMNDADKVAQCYLPHCAKLLQFGVRTSSPGEDISNVYDLVHTDIILKHHHIYISIDVSIIDAALTSALCSEPFGWTWEQLRASIFRCIDSADSVIGIDVCELVPNGVIERTVAILLRDIVAYIWTTEKYNHRKSLEG